jgi:glutaryl-CoA dehydrogenase
LLLRACQGNSAGETTKDGLDGGRQRAFDPHYRWDNPFDLGGRLTDDERMIRAAARSFARDRRLPRVVAAFRDEVFDRAIMTEMGEMGFLGAMLPEPYGGAAASHLAYGLIAREIEAIDSG